MKKFRLFILAILCISMCLVCTKDIQVLAEELPNNIVLEGASEGIIFIPGNEDFLVKENMLPGTKVSRRMQIINNYTDAYELYMRAERVTKEEEFDLLKKINIKIFYKDTIIYDGPTTGENGMNTDIYLGNYSSGDEAELYAVATLDGKAIKNEYKNKRAEVRWIFTANRKEKDKLPQEETEYKGYITKTGENNNVLWYVFTLCIGIISLYIAKEKIGRRGV